MIQQTRFVFEIGTKAPYINQVAIWINGLYDESLLTIKWKIVCK